MAKRKRDVTRTCGRNEFLAKLRRVAAAIKAGRGFAIQVGGERLFVPAAAELSIEHEREDGEEELELQFRWKAATTRGARR
jgi:amphi-Trp domain-containing protein